jgi:hypothetical protein
VEDEIIKIEEQIIRAQLIKDTEFFEKVLDDQFKFVSP